MNNKLEKFVQANREAFDDEQPSAGVWGAVEKKFGDKANNALEKFVQTNKEAFDDEQPSAEVWNAIEKQFAPAAADTLEKFVAINRDAFDNEQPAEKVWNAIEKKFGIEEKTGNTLEKFVTANRDAFDSEQPADTVRRNIEKQFEEKQPEKVFTIKRSVVRMMLAAAAVIIIAIGAWYITGTKNDIPGIAKTTPKADTPANQAIAQVTPPVVKQDATTTIQPQKDSSDNSNADNSSTAAAPVDEQQQEIYYYASLTEIKFNQLKRMEKTEPVLYKSFAGEITKLDSAYHGLQTMLSSGSADKESILNAMLTNLKMQAEILNKQLYIIHSIKQSKKSKNENNYPSI